MNLKANRNMNRTNLTRTDCFMLRNHLGHVTQRVSVFPDFCATDPARTMLLHC